MAHSAMTTSAPGESREVASAHVPGAALALSGGRQTEVVYCGGEYLPTYAEVLNNRSLYSLREAEASSEQQPQLRPDGVTSAVIQQQPTTSVTAIPEAHRRVPPVLDRISMGTMAPATAAASGIARPWMPKPFVSTLCPPGLEYLADLNLLAFFDIRLDILVGSDVRPVPRRFQVLNALRQQVYSADMRLGTPTSLVETVFTDSTGQALIMVKMKQVPCRYDVGFNCCSSSLDATVDAPPGCSVGSVEQERPGGFSFIVKSIEGFSLRLKARENLIMCCGCVWNINPSWEFTISSLDNEHEIGCIKPKRIFSGLYDRRVLTHIALVFPADLNARMKATLAGAALFLHYCFFGNEVLREYHS